MIDFCRVCGATLKHLLTYENMPKAAQHLPEAADLATERGLDLEVCHCPGCDLIQLANEPVPYYKEVIRAAAYSEEMGVFRRRQFKQFVEDYGLDGKKIVEIGCGKGEFLDLMRDTGASVYGIEYAAESVRECQNKGLNVKQEYLEKASSPLDNAPFDAFFTLNFMEHFPDPNGTLGSLVNNLTAGAIGLVEVPNFEMMIKNKVFSEFIGDHLLYFTKETLERTLSQNGFEVLECKEIWYDYILSAVVRKRRPQELSNFKEHQGLITASIKKYINGVKSGSIAIYGAGHQSFAIISLTKIGNDVKYVVDDAPFKQGKYTPATHVPIVGVEQLALDPVDGIIVMAGGYSDEVATKLAARTDLKVSVAILRDYGLELLGEPSE